MGLTHQLHSGRFTKGRGDLFSENQRLSGQFQNEKKKLVSAGNHNLVQYGGVPAPLCG